MKRSFVLAFVGVLVACGHAPPYARGQAPSVDTLLLGARPQLEAITVSEASIVLNRLARADLALLAQAPARFRGSVTKSGNELVTLAFHERGYALRYKLEELPAGFYAGPPSPCAVQAMLGVPIAYEGLVALVLGGAPVLDAPWTLLEQSWDRDDAFERLVLANDRFEEELRFAWVGGAWRFTGAAMWTRSGGRRARALWTLEHDDHESVGGVVLPGRTRIRTEGPDDQLIVITYRSRDLDPPWATAARPTSEDLPTDADAPPPSEGDPWNDDDTPPTGQGDPWDDREAREDPPEAGKAQPAAPRPNPIPPVFELDGTGLVPRGDLCHR